MDFKDFKDQLLIDRDDLDGELVKFASSFQEISERYVQSVSMRDMAKSNLDQVKAIVATDIRLRVSSDGGKITEKKLEEEVLSTDSVLEATATHLNYKHVSDEWSALKDAFHQRGYMLRDLCSLYIAGYYAVDSVRETKDVGRAATKAVKSKLAKGRKSVASKKVASN